jgi:hypothetical protein
VRTWFERQLPSQDSMLGWGEVLHGGYSDHVFIGFHYEGKLIFAGESETEGLFVKLSCPFCVCGEKETNHLA